MIARAEIQPAEKPVYDHHLRRVRKEIYRADSAQTHLIVEYLYRAKAFFAAKMYHKTELIMHIPPPLRALLVQVTTTHKHVAEGAKSTYGTRLVGIRCTPAYENRIVISHPDYAIYQNEPMVIIELEHGTNYPTYYELNG